MLLKHVQATEKPSCETLPIEPFEIKKTPTFLNSNSIWTQWTKSHLVDVPLLRLLIPMNSHLFTIYILFMEE